MPRSADFFSIIMITISFLVLCYLTLFEVPMDSLVPLTDASLQTSNDSSSSDLPLYGNASSDAILNGSNPGELQVRYTGIIRSDISPEVARGLGLNETYPGLIITEVLPGSPAERAGLQGANQVRAIEGEIVRFGGDIIVAVDGNRSAVEDRQAFIDYLQNEKRIGDNITLSILRNGDVRKANLTIAPMPEFFWYINPDEKIRMKYPSDWEVSDSNLGRGDVIKFFSPEENSGTEDAAATISVRVVPSEGATLDELALREREGVADTRPLDVKGREVSGQQAYESTYFDYGDNSTKKAKSIFTIRDDDLYIINFISDPSRYDDYVPMVEEMVKSFRFDREEE